MRYMVLHDVTWCYMSNIYFDFEQMKFKGITVNDAMRWETLFPDVDVIKAIKVDMPVWLESKAKTKQAHKKNWTSFILKWLKRSQERSIR